MHYTKRAIYLGNKEIYCIFNMGSAILDLFSPKWCLFHNVIFLCLNVMCFINHVQNFKYQRTSCYGRWQSRWWKVWLLHPSLHPNSHGGGICYFSQTESLDDSHKAGFQMVNSSLEPALFAMFTDSLWAYAFVPASEPTSSRSKRLLSEDHQVLRPRQYTE